MVIATGIDPVQLTEYAVVLSVIALPLTFLPILLVARDRTLMGEHANGLLANTLGWLYLRRDLRAHCHCPHPAARHQRRRRLTGRRARGGYARGARLALQAPGEAFGSGARND